MKSNLNFTVNTRFTVVRVPDKIKSLPPRAVLLRQRPITNKNQFNQIRKQSIRCKNLFKPKNEVHKLILPNLIFLIQKLFSLQHSDIFDFDKK